MYRYVDVSIIVHVCPTQLLFSLSRRVEGMRNGPYPERVGGTADTQPTRKTWVGVRELNSRCHNSEIRLFSILYL